jgi:hypothetical protein
MQNVAAAKGSRLHQAISDLMGEEAATNLLKMYRQEITSKFSKWLHNKVNGVCTASEQLYTVLCSATGKKIRFILHPVIQPSDA